MTKPIVFLDIDGVLNGHDFNDGAGSNTIRPSCIAALNYIIAKADPQIVLSSAWRYMILTKHLTLTGFEYLLRTHGACGIVGNLIGTTCADEECVHCLHRGKIGKGKYDDEGQPKCRKCGQSSCRAFQVDHWLIRNQPWQKRWVVIDDGDYRFREIGHPFVQTDPSVGLTMKDARKAVKFCVRLLRP